jgi:hypothetical protein
MSMASDPTMDHDALGLRRRPGWDEVDDTMAALTRAGRALRKARGQSQTATAAAKAVAHAAAEDGRSEVVIAATLGVHRLTVRRWLGRT